MIYGATDFNTLMGMTRNILARPAITLFGLSTPPPGGPIWRLLPVRGRLRQERADPALRLAARRHGRPDARSSALIHAATMVTAGRLHDRPDDFIFAIAPVALHGGGCSIGRPDRPRRRHHRPRPERHQEGPGLLHRLPARLHVHGRGRRRLRRRHLPRLHPRLLQGRPLPRRRLGDPWPATTSRTCATWAGCAGSMPWTFASMGLATLAIAGSSPSRASSPRTRSSGRCSRAGTRTATPSTWCAWSMGMIAAFMTAFYMVRLMVMTFFGEYRGAGHDPYGLTVPSEAHHAALTPQATARRSWPPRRPAHVGARATTDRKKCPGTCGPPCSSWAAGPGRRLPEHPPQPALDRRQPLHRVDLPAAVPGPRCRGPRGRPGHGVYPHGGGHRRVGPGGHAAWPGSSTAWTPRGPGPGPSSSASPTCSAGSTPSTTWTSSTKRP